MRAKQKVDKQKVLKDLLKGKVNLAALKPPQSYIVTVKEGKYNVSGATIPTNLVLNEVEYNKFKSTLREQDIVFELFFCDFSETDEQAQQRQLPAPQKQIEYRTSQIKEDYSPANTPAKQTPAKGAKSKKKPVKTIEQTVIQMKQSGLLSEYGESWKASFIR